MIDFAKFDAKKQINIGVISSNPVQNDWFSTCFDQLDKVQLQELDETDYWLDLLVKACIYSEKKLEPLIKETNESIAIFVTIVTNLKHKGK